jgi:predicted nucleotidyltransferase
MGNPQPSLIADPVIAFVLQIAKTFPGVKQVVLFGSRARKDHHARSDYDLAVEFDPNINDREATPTLLALMDEAPTLCKMDVVQLKPGMDPGFRSRIDREGITLYHRRD